VTNWVFGDVCADDAYKGSTPSDQGEVVEIETWTTSFAPNHYVNEKWLALYDGVQRCNDVLRVMRGATGLSAADTLQYASEARFLRGLYHFEAKKMWKNVPWVGEDITVTAGNYRVSNTAEIYPNIEADFTFAMTNLPETQTQKGRANKWAAAAFLAKVYMFEHKYAQAKTLLDQLIASGKTTSGVKYALINYGSNFNPAQKNSSESVFSCQMSVNDGSGTNGNYGESLNFPNNGNAPGGCCGFHNPSANLANAYKTDAVTGLPLLDTYNSGNVVSAATNPYAGTLDPRVDWAMGRPGIPYLDWGLVDPSLSWIRDPPTDGSFSPKKNVYAKSQTGTLSSTETSFWGPTQIDANNYTFIRYSDVLLWDAECEVEVGSLATAETYVNLVRARAALPASWVYAGGATFNAGTFTYSPQTTPAANYKVSTYPVGTFAAGGQAFGRKAVQFERRLELSLEGHRFFDLQRWDNGTGTMAAVINAYVATEKSRPSIYAVNASATFKKGINEIFPIPQAQIDVENSTGTVYLKQNPGYN
jgi:starch-binding outer membrane protein, SusD/RagB family